MGLEASVAKTTQETAKQGVRTVETIFRKVWSIMDAAAEKQAPSEYLSSKAIAAIQGKKQG